MAAAWIKFLPPSLLSILTYPKYHPVKFGLGFSCLKTSFADFIVQRYVEGRKNLDIHRNIAFGAFGLFYLGGVQYFLYVPVFRRLFPYALTWGEKTIKSKIQDRKGLWTMMKQVFIDQCVHHPFSYFPCFYITKAIVTGGTLQNAKENYKKNIFDDMVALWKVWIPATIINFTVSPFWFRIPFVACTSLLWTCILSTMRGATDNINPQETVDVIGNVGTALTHALYHHDNPKNIHFVLVATGQDRVGLVSDIAYVISKNGGNIFESRMTRLGGDFTIIMLLGVDKDHTTQLTTALTTLRDLHIITRETTFGSPEKLIPNSDGSFSFHGPDQPGIVYTIMQCFKKHHLNIQTLITEANPNLESGNNYFDVKGTFSVPKDIHLELLEEDLEMVRGQLPSSTLDFRLSHSLEGKETTEL